MEINVLIEDDFKGCPEASWLKGIAERALQAENTGPNVELGLVITGQEKVRELNRSYLGRDEPTDVLAFPMLPTGETEAGLPPFITPPDDMVHLGEVIIAYPQAAIQAEEHRHSIRKELALLTVHGVLHLLGYEDEAPEPKRQMAAREREILSHIEAELN